MSDLEKDLKRDESIHKGVPAGRAELNASEAKGGKSAGGSGRTFESAVQNFLPGVQEGSSEDVGVEIEKHWEAHVKALQEQDEKVHQSLLDKILGRKGTSAASVQGTEKKS